MGFNNVAHAFYVWLRHTLLYEKQSYIFVVPVGTVALTTWIPYPIGARYLHMREGDTLQT